MAELVIIFLFLNEHKLCRYMCGSLSCISPMSGMYFANLSFWLQIVHLSGQVDDLVELETEVVDRLHLLLSSLEKRTHPRKPYKVNILYECLMLVRTIIRVIA